MAKSKTPATLQRYPGYDWGKSDHDPMIDRMATMKADENLSDAEISRMTGISVTTLRNWFDRKIRGKRKPTMRPMFTTVMAFNRGLGYDLQIVKLSRAPSPSAGIRITRNVAAKANAVDNRPSVQH